MPKTQKTKLGVSFFDREFGGIPLGKSTLCWGRKRSGKSALAIQFIDTCVKSGDHTLLLTEKSSEEIRRFAMEIGVRLDDAEASGALSILTYENLDVDGDGTLDAPFPFERSLEELHRIVDRNEISHVVFQPVAPWVAILPVDYIHSRIERLIDSLEEMDVTSLFILDHPVSAAAYALRNAVRKACPVVLSMERGQNRRERILRVEKYNGAPAEIDFPHEYHFRIDSEKKFALLDNRDVPEQKADAEAHRPTFSQAFSHPIRPPAPPTAPAVPTYVPQPYARPVPQQEPAYSHNPFAANPGVAPAPPPPPPPQPSSQPSRIPVSSAIFGPAGGGGRGGFTPSPPVLDEPAPGGARHFSRASETPDGMMYRTYWNLSDSPFLNMADEKFILETKEHAEALARLFFLLEHERVAGMITGSYGVGKTMLLTRLQHRAARELRLPIIRVDAIPNGALQLARYILHSIGINNPVDTLPDALMLFQDYCSKGGRGATRHLLFIDEAQYLADGGGFYFIHYICNLRIRSASSETPLFTTILSGTDDLASAVENYDSLRRRIQLSCHLNPLTPEETAAYIQKRMTAVGGDAWAFTPDALAAVHAYTQGVPRSINNLCDIALLLGFSAQVSAIDATIIREAAADAGFSASSQHETPQEARP